MDTNTNDTEIDGSDRVHDLSVVVADLGGEGNETEDESEVGTWRSLFGVEAAVTSALLADDDDDEDDEVEEAEVEEYEVEEDEAEEDGVEEPGRLATESTKKKQKHRAMSAEEQVATIAALQEKLSVFPASQPKPSSSISPKKAAAGQTPVDSVGPTSPASAEIEPKPGKKRKRTSKPKIKPPKPPRPQKRGKKKSKALELKSASITPVTEALVDMLAELHPSSTVRDVQNVVDKAGEILDDKPSGKTFDEEIKALLDREEGWKAMARQADTGLKEDIKKFMERYGIIPMGALEAAESKAMETSVGGET